MAAAKGKKQGMMAFAVGVIAAPMVGVAAVAFVVGVGLILYANSDTSEPEEDVAFGFAEPEDIQASELEARRAKTRRNTKRRASPSPDPSGDADTRTASRRSSTPADGPSRSGAKSQSGSTPAMPAPPKLDDDDGLRPDTRTDPRDGDVVDVRDLPDPDEDDGGAFSPPDVAAPSPATRTSTDKPGPGPHEFAEDEGPSWIPDTFRTVVESGIALFTGEPETTSSDAAPAMPEVAGARTPAAVPAEDNDDGDAGEDDPAPKAARTAPRSDDGVAEASPARTSDDAPEGTQEARPEEAAPITPSGAGEPNPSVVPETSAMPTADPEDGPMPFTPEPAAPEPAAEEPAAEEPAAEEPVGEDGTTFDNLVSGGMDMVTGKGGPRVAAAPTRTRTKSETEMEEDIGTYVDPAGGADEAPLDFEDDYSFELDDHDAAASFGTTESDEDITAPVNLDDLIIPVRIITATPGVAVTVDGSSLGTSPARKDLSDEDHTVVVGSGDDQTTFTIAPMANPDEWCFDTKSSGGYRQVPCD